MKRFFILFLFSFIMLAGCGKQVKLKKGSPVYGFAKEIAVKVPFLDPDKNNVLVSTKKFKISSGEVLEEIYSTYGKGSEQLKGMSPEQIKFNVEQTAMDLGGKKILLEQAGQLKINVTQAQVDSVFNAMVQQRGGKENFDAEINKLGIGLDVVKRDLRTQFTIDRFFGKHFEKDLQISEQDIQQAYSEGRTATVRHILLLTGGKNDTAKMKIYQKMEMIQARLKKGEDFARLANQFSEDPGSGKKGGLIENFQRGDMVPPFDEAAFSVSIGGMSDIFDTEYGYHILKVVDRKKDTRPVDAIRPELKKQVEQKKRRELYSKIQSYMDQLKQEYIFTVMKF